MKTFKILVADDYHEFDSVPKGFKVKELGCFPHKNYKYSMYLAVQYKGKKPSQLDVWKAIYPLIKPHDNMNYYIQIIAEIKENYDPEGKFLSA